MLVGCSSRIVIDQTGCAKVLMERFGPDQVLERRGKLQKAGAFGS